MDQETRALRAEIAQTRSELGEAVEDLSSQLAPRRQAQKLVTERREALVQRLRALSPADAEAAAARAREAVRRHPRATAAATADALALARRRRRR